MLPVHGWYSAMRGNRWRVRPTPVAGAARAAVTVKPWRAACSLRIVRALGPRTMRLSPTIVTVSWCAARGRSEEHTSELQSQSNLVCRLLLEKKKNKLSQTQNQPCRVVQHCE